MFSGTSVLLDIIQRIPTGILVPFREYASRRLRLGGKTVGIAGKAPGAVAAVLEERRGTLHRSPSGMSKVGKSAGNLPDMRSPPTKLRQILENGDNWRSRGQAMAKYRARGPPAHLLASCAASLDSGYCRKAICLSLAGLVGILIMPWEGSDSVWYFYRRSARGLQFPLFAEEIP